MLKYWYLIAYDIAHPRRLRRVHRQLSAQGYPLQNSVFLCQGNVAELRQLYQQLSSELQPAEDDLRIFPLASMWYLQFWGIHAMCDDLHDSQWPAYKNLLIGEWAGRVQPIKKHFESAPLRYA
ncbi:MAG: CRISPR-associated endonuclease Cas2 [Alcaligenaceae bacterium]|nr:CRISPR-associated endonuclease Cas2 [Alcaligenaceae bacterium]